MANRAKESQLRVRWVRADRYHGFSNRVWQLDKTRYQKVGNDQLADDENFLYKFGRVNYLMVTGSGLKPGPYALFSKAKAR